MRARGLAAMAALVLGCGGSGARAGVPNGDHAGGAGSDDQGAPQCTEIREPEHPSYSSETLTLEFLEHHRAPRDMVIPPLAYEVSVQEDLVGPVQMELTVYDPNGETTVETFTHENMREVCDPYCLPTRAHPRCAPRRCWAQRFRPPRRRIDHTIYRPATPGQWTYVLHRLDNDERVSLSRRLFEGELLEDDACEAIPLRLGDFRRVECRGGVVPMGTTTNHWGLKARYLNGNCRANAFALPLSNGVRSLFDEGPYHAAPKRAFPDGTVHEVRIDEVLGRAWLAEDHFYLLAGRRDLPGYDELTNAYLRAFPVVDGPVRAIPNCAATGAVEERTVTPVALTELTGGGARFMTHFEGNRPSGVRMSFHDRHPLALAGLRRQEVLYTVDGAPVSGRREIATVLEPMTVPGRMEIVIGSGDAQGARCVRLTIEEALAVVQPPPPPPPPPPPGPGRGRHCERHSDQCWDCVEFDFPAEVGCQRACPRGDVCVRLGGQRRCLEPTRICCQAGQNCNTPPGCEGAASSCSGDAAGRQERCTFLRACPAPLPGR